MNSSTFLSIVCLKICRPNLSDEAVAVLLRSGLCVFPAPCSPEHGGLFFRAVCDPRTAAGESCCSTEVQSRAVYPSRGNTRCEFFPKKQLSAVQVPSPGFALSFELLTMAAEDSLLSRHFQKGSSFPISCSAVLSIFRGIKFCAHFCLGLLHFPRSISSYLPLTLTEMMRNGLHFYSVFLSTHTQTHTETCLKRQLKT